MKTKVFETGAVCAAVALLLVLSLPAYAKSGGSSASHTRLGKTSTNATSVKPVTSSQRKQSGTLQKSGGVAVQPKSTSKMGTADKTKKEVDTIKQPLGKLDVKIKELTGEIQKIETKQSTEADRIKSQQDKSGSIQKNLEAEAERSREMGNTINCLANC